MYHQSNCTLATVSASLLLCSGLTLPACSDDLRTEVERAILNEDSSESSSSDQSLSRGATNLSVDAADAGDSGSAPPPVNPNGIVLGPVTNQGEIVPDVTSEDTGDAGNAMAVATNAEAARVNIRATNGSGCAGQTATVSSVAESSFTIRFGGYTARLGADLSLARRNCVFGIEIEPPPGMTYAVTGVRQSGEASLERGATARSFATYFYQGVSQTSAVSENIPGAAGNWSTDGAFAESQVQFAPCGLERLLLLNTSVALNGPDGAESSRISVDPEITVQLALAKCEAAE
jgi:hypothetical protein